MKGRNLSTFKINQKIDSLLRKGVYLLILSFICTAVIIRGELIGEKYILYTSSGILGLLFAVLAAMICTYILGIKEGIKCIK